MKARSFTSHYNSSSYIDDEDMMAAWSDDTRIKDQHRAGQIIVQIIGQIIAHQQIEEWSYIMHVKLHIWIQYSGYLHNGLACGRILAVFRQSSATII